MGAIEDYYKRQQELALRLGQQQDLLSAQQNAAASGLDPALAGQGQTSTIAQALGGAPAGGPSATSYTPQQNGGAVTGSAGILGTLAGQDPTHVNPALQATLPDAGDVASVAAANAEHKRLVDEYHGQLADLGKQVQDAMNRGDIATGMRLQQQFIQLNARGEPAPPDMSAIQHQSDRNRLLNIGIGAYTPLISQLSSAAAGNGPSAALNYYRAAADDANRRTLGAAAGARGTGGQRAALYSAALRQNAESTQGAANQAAQIGAQEQNQARASLNSALAGLTNVYGTSNLLGDTQQQQKANQDAQNNAIGLNTQIAESNAKNKSDFAKSVVDTAAKAIPA